MLRVVAAWVIFAAGCGAHAKFPGTQSPDTDQAAGDDSAGAEPNDTAGDGGPDLHDTGLVNLSPHLPIAFVADNGNGRYLYQRLDNASIAHDIELKSLDPDLCSDGECIAFGGHADVDPSSGEDRVLLAFQAGGEAAHAVGVAGVIQRAHISEDADVVDWTLDRLDFLTNFSDRPDLCSQTEACTIPDGAVEEDQRRCRLDLPHVAVIESEDADSVVLWIADTNAPSRVLEVTLDKSTDCGVVDDVLNQDTVSDWDDADSINDIDIIDVDGDEQLLLNSLGPMLESGRSNTTLWRKVGSDWNRLWHYPDKGFLAANHNPDIVTLGDGLQYLVYANSNGEGEHDLINDFTGTDDNKGTIGVARIGPEGPEYLFDATIEPGFGYLRDVNLLEDGSWIVTDSGCIYSWETDCTNTPGIWNVSIPDPTEAVPSVKGGSFTADHSDMDILDATALDTMWTSPEDCGLSLPFSAEFHWSDDLGRRLRVEATDPDAECP